MSDHINVGLRGEQAAVDFLVDKKYKILDRNWRYKKLEIDIIAFYNDTLVVVEVKSRTGTYFEQPFQAVTKKKQRFIIEAANAYIDKHEIDYETRFDIISIVEQHNKFNIEHIEDAFYPLV